MNDNNSGRTIICGKKELGSGGFAFVYEGFYRLPVAVKRVQLEHVVSNPHEEAILRKLNHPNVIKLWHVESDSNFRYNITSRYYNDKVNTGN